MTNFLSDCLAWTAIIVFYVLLICLFLFFAVPAMILYIIVAFLYALGYVVHGNSK